MRQDIIDKCLTQFETIYPDVKVPRIEWCTRMRTTAGKVKFNMETREVKCIVLNQNLLTEESQIESTLMHELAHVADWYVYRKCGHGRTWRHVMIKLGRNPRRCHNYDTSSLKRKHKRVAQMQCNCRTIEITNIRFKKVMNGTVYRCRNCATPLKLVA